MSHLSRVETGHGSLTPATTAKILGALHRGRRDERAGNALDARAQAAEYCGVGQRTICCAVRAGELRAARFGSGRNFVVRRDWLDTWLAGRAEGGILPERPRRQIPSRDGE